MYQKMTNHKMMNGKDFYGQWNSFGKIFLLGLCILILSGGVHALEIGGRTAGYFNGTMDEVRVYNRTLSADEVRIQYNAEFSKFNSTEWRFYDNITNLTDGSSYNYYGWANDSAGNWNSSEIRRLTIDTTLPQLSFNLPTPANNSYIPRNFTEVNVTITELNLDGFIFSWNNTNYSFYDSSLVLAMNFNNNPLIGENSSRAVDISKFGNNGTFTGENFNTGTCYGVTGQVCNWTTSGKFGGALRFDGVDDYVEVPNSPRLNITNKSLTVTAWFNTKSTGFQGIAIKMANGAPVGGYRLIIEAGGYLRGEIVYGPDLTINIGSPATSTIATNSWIYGAVTYNGSNLVLYINGTQVASTATTVDITDSSSYNLEIGAGIPTNTGNFNGTIDEVRIYNRALSQGEIQANMNSTFPVNGTGLVASYRFEENSGNTTQDSHNFVAGRFGGAVQFDGVDDYVNASITNFPTGSNSISGFAWIYIKSYANNGVSQQVFSYGTCCAVSNSTFDLFVYTNGQLYASNWGNIGDVVPLNQWNFVGITYQANSTNATVYLNSQAYTTPNAQALNISSNNPMRIGLRVDGSYYFNGSIDEVRIYNRALSSAEILMQYNAEFQKYNSTEWRFYNNITNLTDGTSYQYYGYANDTAGNSNSSEIRRLTVDTTLPVITWNLPANDNSSIVGWWFVQNITVQDTNLADLNCTITNSSANIVWNSWWNLTGYNNFTVSNWTNLAAWNTGTYNESCIARDLTFFFGS